MYLPPCFFAMSTSVDTVVCMIFRLSAWMATYLLSFGAGGRLKKMIGILAALAVRMAGMAALLSVGMKTIPSTLRSTIAFT